MNRIDAFVKSIVHRIEILFDLVSRWYWNVIFHIVKYRYLIVSIVLIVPTVLLFQYWKELTRAPYSNTSSVSSRNVEIVLSYPDRIGIGKKNAGQLEFDFQATRSFTNEITIDLKSYEKNNAVKFTPAFLAVKPVQDGYIDRQDATVEYKWIKDPRQSFTMTADIQIGQRKPLQVENTIRVNRTPPEIAGISSFASALSSVVGLVLQLKQLFFKK